MDNKYSRLPSKQETTPPPYIERYTPIKLRPQPVQGSIRIVRALGLETLDLTTAKLITQANKEEEYKDLLKAIKTISNPKDIPNFSPLKEYSPVWENLSIQDTECGETILHNNKALIIPKNHEKPTWNHEKT